MNSITLAPLPGAFEAYQTRVGSILRELADWHEGRTASAAETLIGRAFAAGRWVIGAAVRQLSGRG
ncbi:MAG: hypothetical protein ICV73_20650 [Acetobacteraceae bacterium]|nr:hypothetical protein [Acetobacteraceae bacterium]